MGNCCQKLFMNDAFRLPLHLDHLEVKINQTTSNAIDNVSPDYENQNEIRIRYLFNDGELAKMINLFFKEFEIYRTQVSLLKSFITQDFKGEVYGMNLPKEDSSELLSVVIQNFSVPFSPEFTLFSALNPVITMVESFSEVDVVSQECYEDSIYRLERYKTEKILIVSSRNIFWLRVIKKLGDNQYVDLLQSVTLLDLIKHKKIKEIYEANQENFATTFVSGTFYEIKDGCCHVSSFFKTDFRSSIKMMFVKMFLAKNFENLLKNCIKNNNLILEQEIWLNKQNLAWFKNSSGEYVKGSFWNDKSLAKTFKSEIKAESTAPSAEILPKENKEELKTQNEPIKENNEDQKETEAKNENGKKKDK